MQPIIIVPTIIKSVISNIIPNQFIPTSVDEEMLCKWKNKCSKALSLDEYGLILCQQQRQNKWCKPSIG